MEITFHVGMGKTGTSSVQSALAQNRDILAESNYEYLGLWLNIIHASYKGYAGFDRFCAQESSQLREDARTFFNRLSVRKASKFIYSNESAFANISAFVPFIEALMDLNVAVRVVIYVRTLNDWLPSAFVQWNAFHKTHVGPIEPFSKKGSELAALYHNILEWIDRLGDVVHVRPFTKHFNIVEDFSDFLGVRLDFRDERVWTRIEDAETVLRAIFNDRFECEVLPTIFEKATRISRDGLVRSIDDFSKLSLDTSGLTDILHQSEGLSEAIFSRTGIEIIENISDRQEPSFDRSEIKDRLLDYLLEMTINQAIRLERLENLLENMQRK